MTSKELKVKLEAHPYWMVYDPFYEYWFYCVVTEIRETLELVHFVGIAVDRYTVVNTSIIRIDDQIYPITKGQFDFFHNLVSSSTGV